MATPRRRAVVFGILSAIGLVRALIDLFGMTAFTVKCRTAEIGVPMAFGARSGQVVWEVFRDAAAPVLVGLVARFSGALAGQISVWRRSRCLRARARANRQRSREQSGVEYRVPASFRPSQGTKEPTRYNTSESYRESRRGN